MKKMKKFFNRLTSFKSIEIELEWYPIILFFLYISDFTIQIDKYEVLPHHFLIFAITSLLFGGVKSKVLNLKK